MGYLQKYNRNKRTKEFENKRWKDINVEFK